MIKIFAPLLLVLCFAVHSHAQTSYDLAAKYHQLATYEVRPGILMTVNFGTGGQACEMILQKDHYEPEKIDLTSSISGKDQDLLLDELAPLEKRGARDPNPLHSLMVAGGITFGSRQEYANVSIERDGGIGKSACEPGVGVFIIRWKNRGCTWEKENSNAEKSSPESSQPTK